jgi:hypothetical protein
VNIFQKKVPNDFNLWCIGDFHIGTVAFAEKPFLNMIKDIKSDSKAKVVGLGDYVEGRSVDHPYFEFNNLDVNSPIAYKQAEVVVKYLDPIRKKILILLEGNHDRYSRNYMGLVENIICKDLGVDFGTWSCIIDFGKFKGHFTHGSDRRSPVRSMSPISSRSQLNERLSLINILSAPNFGDCVINTCGHYHRMITYNPSDYDDLCLLVKGNELQETYKTPSHGADIIPPFERFYASSGAWLKSYVNGISTYGERAMFKAVSIGCIVYEIRGGKVKNVEARKY